MTKSTQPNRHRRRRRSAVRVAYDNPGGGARALDAIIAARPFPPLSVQQMREKWLGVFEPEFWEEVRRAARLEKSLPSP